MGNSYKLFSVGLLLEASHGISDVTLHSSLQNRRLPPHTVFLAIPDTSYAKRGAMGCRSVLEFSQCLCKLFVIASRSIISRLSANKFACSTVQGTRYATEPFWFVLNI